MSAPMLRKRIDEWRNAMDLTESFSLDRTAPEKIPELWDRIAEGFDCGLGQNTERVEKTIEILAHIGALSEDTVAIDIGCGTGSFTLELAKRCRRVYALDLSPKMLDILEQKAERLGITNIVTILGDWKTFDSFDPEINLALSCLNTGINDFESLDKMNKISAGWCCYITVSGVTQNSSRNELQEIVFGRTLQTAFGNDVLFPFNIVYTMGYKPEVRYIPCNWNRSLGREEALEEILDDYSRYKDIDAHTRRHIAHYIFRKFAKDGAYTQTVNATLGLMAWKTQEMRDALEKKHEHPHAHGHGHAHGGHANDGHEHPHKHDDHGHSHEHVHSHTHGDGHTHGAGHTHSVGHTHDAGHTHCVGHTHGAGHTHGKAHAAGHTHEEDHTHSHDHSHRYFSDIHADLASQFFGTLHHVPDTEEIAGLRKKLNESPDDYDTLMALAGCLSFQLRYREAIGLYDRALAIRQDNYSAMYERAARHFKTLQFEKAYADYVRCLEISPDTSDAIYRLGITEYVMQKNVDAERHMSRCFELYRGDPEMLVASAYWLALTDMRLPSQRGLWKTYDFTLDTPHHVGYRDSLRVLTGLDRAEKAYEKWRGNEDKLNASIVMYALVVHYRNAGEITRANELYSELMTLDEFWAGIAFVAAFAERLQ